MIKGNLKRMGLMFITLLILTGCSSNEEPETTGTTEAISQTFESSVEMITDEEENENYGMNESDYKSECQYMDYKKFFRYEEKYKGTKVLVNLEVSQIIDGNLRCYSDSDGDGFYMDEEYYIIDDRVNKDMRILVDDNIMVWGEYTGSTKMTRAINGVEEDIVTISAKFIDLYDENDYLLAQEDDELPYDMNEEYMWEEERDAARNQYVPNIYYPDEYIISWSNEGWVDFKTLDGMTYDEARLALNEIYARHGRKFKDQGLQDFFNGKSWYNGTIEPDQFDESVFNTIEKDNIDTIREYMESVKE